MNYSRSNHKAFTGFLPVLLTSLAFWDLRVEIRIILDHFTLTSLMFAFVHHTLAVVVLLLSPLLWKKYDLL